ncbi:zf-HC2 domain-containing protein [Blautia obeum]|uniref:zf-HC2 domain-containing protein n=1 Tax=Blautia obeum TaxID=40520 RepID=UPI002A87763F|nr:zf-HC2 domain-containing protein [Oliverpabstia sp.]
MKCEIIRDLFPSYIDGLTSKESNQAIEEHLEGCRECRRYLEEMQREIASEELTQEERKKRQKEIQPLRKVRKVNLRKIGIAVLITSIICFVMSGGFAFYSEWGQTADYDDVRISYEKTGEVVTIGFHPKREDIRIDVDMDLDLSIQEDQKESIRIIKALVSPFSRQIREGGYWGITFVDEDTILSPNGEGTIDLSGDEKLEIQFNDVTKTVTIKDLYTEKGITDLEN